MASSGVRNWENRGLEVFFQSEMKTRNENLNPVYSFPAMVSAALDNFNQINCSDTMIGRFIEIDLL